MFSDGFIWFGDCGMRPALIALLAYIGLMVIWCKKNKHKYEQDKSISKFKTQKYQLVWAALIAVFFLLLFFGQSELENLRELCLNYTRVEGIVVTIILVASVSVYIYQGNSAQFANLMVKVVRIACIVSLYSNYLSGVCLVTNAWNIIIITSILVYLFMGTDFQFVECKPDSNEARCNASVFEPKEKYLDLSENFRKVADRLVNIIKMDSAATYSICLAGDWGIGKTSIVHGAMERLRRSNEAIYEVIYINALELDTSESLFRYLFARIKQILKKNGVYVGIGSTYRKFVGSAVDTITKSSLSMLLEGELFSENEDYRDQKIALSHLIGKAIGIGRIVVVVDDIERCHKEKVKDYLFFVKEIASLERCIPIFVTDYDRLVAQIKGIEEDSHIFLDKFFNYTVHVADNAADEIIRLMQESIKSQCSISYLKKINIQETIEPVRFRLDNKANNNGHLHEYLLAKEKLDRDMKNSRTLVKIFEKLKVYYLALNTRYDSGILNKRATNNVNQEVEKYGEEIDLHSILFFLAYTECCAPKEFKKIVYASEEYLEKVNPQNIVDETTALVTDLVDYTFNRSNMSFYSRKKALHFLYLVLNCEEQLADAVNSYGSEFERNLDYMNRGLYEDISKSFRSVCNAVLTLMSEEKNKITSSDLQSLIKFLAYEIDRTNGDMAAVITLLNKIMALEVNAGSAELMKMLFIHTHGKLTSVSASNKYATVVKKYSSWYVRSTMVILARNLKKLTTNKEEFLEDIETKCANENLSGVMLLAVATEALMKMAGLKSKCGTWGNSLAVLSCFLDVVRNDCKRKSMTLEETAALGIIEGCFSEIEYWYKLEEILLPGKTI